MIKSVYHNTAMFGVEEAKLRPLEKLLMSLEGQLLDGVILQVCWVKFALTDNKSLPIWDDRLVSSVGRAPDCSAGGRGFEPQTGPTLRVLI